jgi:hypothetical protein
MASFWTAPEGVKVAANGAWSVGGLPIRHLPSLRLLKARLNFTDDGAFLMDGPVRLPVRVEGPPFEVSSLRLDAERGEARAVLDDGSEEPLRDLGMEAASGRFVCAVRGGRAFAVLSRAAHQSLLSHVEQENGQFFLPVGQRRLPVRT